MVSEVKDRTNWRVHIESHISHSRLCRKRHFAKIKLIDGELTIIEHTVMMIIVFRFYAMVLTELQNAP
jgi:hypothetical protein